MSYWGQDASSKRLEAYKAVVLAFIAERGPVPRADIWQSLDGRVSVGHVDRSLKTLLAEGRIQGTKANLAKSLEGGHWKSGKPLRYTATVYEIARERP